MNVRIVRGARQIGGSMVEVESQGRRLVIDAGIPLDADPVQAPAPPPVAGLTRRTPDLLGVVVTHGHLDHFGLLPQLDRRVPLFMGADAHRLLREAAFFSPASLPDDLPLTGALRDREPFRLGPFTITPHLVDHSAIDAYGLLVEADGERLFYSGDLRAHGDPRSWRRLLDDPPTGVDALLLEGTRITPNTLGDTPTEEDTRDALSTLMAYTEGTVGVVVSSQNLERIATVRDAATHAGRTLVCDLYVHTMCGVVDDPRLPRIGDLRTRVYLPGSQRRRVQATSEYGRTYPLRTHRIFEEEIRYRAGELVFVGTTGMIREIARQGWLERGAVAWSLWPGYLTPELRRSIGVPVTVAHASGHAHPRDLQDLARAIAPQRVIPVHTNHPEQYHRHFDRVELWEDMEWRRLTPAGT